MSLVVFSVVFGFSGGIGNIDGSSSFNIEGFKENSIDNE